MKVSEKLKGHICPKWLKKLTPLLDSPVMEQLFAELSRRKSLGKVIYPAQEDIFNVFKQPFDDIKVVILGQDPYHGFGQANGYAFATNEKKCPPSLRNILKEVEDDIYNGLNLEKDPNDFTLKNWTNQGVFLLNTALTVEEGSPGSHIDLWTKFTVEVMKILSEDKPGLIYMLWGKKAQLFKVFLNQKTSFILEAPHPSPLAGGGFFGCKHFSRANEIINGLNGKEFIINW